MKACPAEDRFWQKVRVGGPEECWEWLAGCGKFGYGRINVRRKTMQAHRFSWEMAYGVPPPDDLILMHTCDNPKCVNPKHLVPGTRTDNATDRDTKGRSKHPAGQDSGSAKLTNAQVLEIRDRLSAGERGASLAREFSVDHSQIYRIKSGHIWASVTGTSKPQDPRK